MKKINIYDVIISPVVSEKSTALGEVNKYVFSVMPQATKSIILDAFEKIFYVKPLSINVLNTKGKSKRFKGVQGRRKDGKKAIVTLQKDHGIEFVSGN